MKRNCGRPVSGVERQPHGQRVAIAEFREIAHAVARVDLHKGAGGHRESKCQVFRDRLIGDR